MKYLILPIIGALFVLVMSGNATSQEVAYCKHGETGAIIVIEANMACPFGYYRI